MREIRANCYLFNEKFPEPNREIYVTQLCQPDNYAFHCIYYLDKDTGLLTNSDLEEWGTNGIDPYDENVIEWFYLNELFE